MKKRTSKIIVLFMMHAIISLCIAGGAMAFSDEPCYGVNYDCEDCTNCEPPAEYVKIGDWSIQLFSRTEVENFPGWYAWDYIIQNDITESTSGLNFAAMLIPDCCTIPKTVVDINQSVGFNAEYPVAEGEPTLYFGRYNEQGFVVKGTRDDDLHFILVANTQAMTSSTILLNLKKGTPTFEMAVPGCTPATLPVVFQQPAITSSSNIETDNGDSFTNIVMDQATQCGKPEKCKQADVAATDCTEISETDLLVAMGRTVEWVAVPGQACRTYVLKTPGNTSYYCSGGRCWY